MDRHGWAGMERTELDRLPSAECPRHKRARQGPTNQQPHAFYHPGLPLYRETEKAMTIFKPLAPEPGDQHADHNAPQTPTLATLIRLVEELIRMEKQRLAAQKKKNREFWRAVVAAILLTALSAVVSAVVTILLSTYVPLLR